MATRVALPARPGTTALKGTLLDASTVVSEFQWIDGVEALFSSYNCLKFQQDPTFCGPNAKDLDQTAGWVSAFRFGAYGGVVCKAIGLDTDEMRSEVERVFNLGESTAVERAMMQTRFVADADATLNRWGAPTDITPASGAVSPKAGIALLEGHAGDNYVGTSTLHIPLTIASLILGVDGAVFEGNVMKTKFGSKIAAGAGYDFPNNSPTGVAATVGEKWLYATGEVLVGRGETVIKQAMDYGTNEVFVLAERPYIAAVDCYAAAVRVKVE